MESFTYASDEGVAAVVAALPERYPMELTHGDMEMLVKALQVAWGDDDGPVGEWAGNFLSSIATTCDVEFI